MEFFNIASKPEWLQYVNANWFDLNKLNALLGILIFSALIVYFIRKAKSGAFLFVRRIPGLESIEEALGRATEIGKPILYISGIGGESDMQTIAAMNILGNVAEQIAHYDTDLKVPCINPIVMTIEQELVKQAYTRAGRPENYKDDSVYYLSDNQFAYASAVSGIMVREKPAANFILGNYAAESLIIAEAGASTGAIQIAGTASISQIPFFIVACDYTLIGEELFAAGAYVSREPLLLGSLKGQDIAKLVIIVVMMLAILLSTLSMVLYEAPKEGEPVPVITKISEVLNKAFDLKAFKEGK